MASSYSNIYTKEFKPKAEFDTPEFRAKQPVLKKRQIELRGRATPSELKLNRLLKETGYSFIFQKGFIAFDYFCIVDFYIKGVKLCIEVDGKYHSTPEQRAKDQYRDKYLQEVRGLQVWRLTNEEVDSMGKEELLYKLNRIEQDRFERLRERNKDLQSRRSKNKQRKHKNKQQRRYKKRN